MYEQLSEDLALTEKILNSVVSEANSFLAGLNTRPAGAIMPEEISLGELPNEGLGALNALKNFKAQYAPFMSGSAGPRFYGLVTGGVTPAALAGDWLVSVYDQNNVGSDESIAPTIELATIRLLRQLFCLPDEYFGTFVTGATMSNFVGLALARQWLGHQTGVNIAEEGLCGITQVRIFSGEPHSSVYKALSMLGIGRNAIKTVECLPNREAINVAILENYLKSQEGQPCIVVANAGTVNTVDFDDIAAIAELRNRYKFWLHVDAAFGGFAACTSKYSFLTKGIEFADSITIDAHKWLNVPYDAAMLFTRHQAIQAEVFQNSSTYLEPTVTGNNYINLTPENSRRLRALPSWFSLMAYGKQGYAEIVERNCDLAQWLGQEIVNSKYFELLSPVRLNGICFTLKKEGEVSIEYIRGYLKRLQRSGDVYLTSTVYKGIPAIRISISNWRTTMKDLDIAWKAMQHEAEQYLLTN